MRHCGAEPGAGFLLEDFPIEGGLEHHCTLRRRDARDLAGLMPDLRVKREFPFDLEVPEALSS